MRIKRVGGIVLVIVLGLLAAAWVLVSLHNRPAYALAEVLYAAPGGNCQGYEPCYGTIQAAVDAAAGGATIKVAQGVFTGTGSEVVSISKAITLTGGYTTTDWVYSLPATQATIVDAENVAGRRGITIDGAGVATITVEGLTSKRGNVPDANGGGIYVLSGTVVLRGNTFQDNSAEYGGGAYLVSGALTLEDNIFQSNLAAWDGGGLALSDGNIRLESNTLHGNSAFRHGGGVSIYAGAVVSQSGNLFRFNSANSGAGIALAGGVLTAVNDILADNLTPWEGVYVTGGALVARHWTLVNNGNYALTMLGGSVALTNTIVASHTVAGFWGAGIAAEHTLFFANGQECGGGAVCTNNLFGDPRFADPAAGNYHIEPDSAAWDAGVNAGVIIDIDGDPRPLVAGYDIGADELQPLLYAYLPLVSREEQAAQPPPLAAPIPVSAEPPIDFDAIRAELQANGQDLSFVKIGFHVGPGGNPTGLGEWMSQLDAAGVPFFLKSADYAGPIWEAQGYTNAPHILVYRKSTDGEHDYDVPNYNLSPQQAALEHWQLHMEVFPPELDSSKVWLETINEVNKQESEWLGEFALETAQLALADGFKWAAFGWSAGEPEPEHWESPAMLEFLELAGNNPDRLAIALHEYSYTVDDIADGYHYKVGRFQTLFQVCDEHNIPRPKVLITEWGWEYRDVPDVSKAMDDIAWASWLYAAFPQVQGAAIWYLGGDFGDIANQTQRLIAPVRDYAQSNYFVIQPGQGQIDPSLFQPPGSTVSYWARE